MLGNDRHRIELAFSLLFSLPGTPVIYYGDELGMGDDLSLPERWPVRTCMQWTDDPNGGFSTAPNERLLHSVIADGEFGSKQGNAAAQQRGCRLSMSAPARRRAQVIWPASISAS